MFTAAPTCHQVARSTSGLPFPSAFSKLGHSQTVKSIDEMSRLLNTSFSHTHNLTRAEIDTAPHTWVLIQSQRDSSTPTPTQVLSTVRGQWDKFEEIGQNFLFCAVRSNDFFFNFDQIF